MFLMVIVCLGSFSKHRPHKHRVRHSTHRIVKKKHKKRKHKKHHRKCAKVSPEAIHDAVIMYSEHYGVPCEIVFSVMRAETGYRGIQHKNYNYHQRSRCGAVGPMQIMPQYAGKVMNRKISSTELLNDPLLNINVGVKMLSRLYKRYSSWERALGAYNTGRPVFNSYSRKVIAYSKSEAFFNCPS